MCVFALHFCAIHTSSSRLPPNLDRLRHHPEGLGDTTELKKDSHVIQVLNTFNFGIVVVGGQGCLVLLSVVRVQQANILGGKGEEQMRAEAEVTV